MDGEVRPEVAAVAQRRDAAARKHGNERPFAAPSHHRVEKNPLTHLTNASTVSEDSAGDGAMTTRASPSNTNSQSIWMWKKTGWKHLDRTEGTGEAF